MGGIESQNNLVGEIILPFESLRPKLLFAQGSLPEIEKLWYNVHLQIRGKSRDVKKGKTE